MADYNEKNHLLNLDGTDSTAGPDVENEEQRDANPLAQDVAEGEGGLTAAMQSIPDTLPVLPVRDVVIFNYMILPLFIGREKSVQAVDAALKNGRHLLVCAQKEESTEDPGPDDLYTVGTVVQVMRMLKMPDSRVKILVQGVSRARVRSFSQVEPFLEAHIETLSETTPKIDPTVEALLRSVREQSEKVLSLRGLSSPDVLAVLQGVDDPGRLADLIAANMRMKTADAQRILEAEDPLDRLMLVNTQLQREVEVATVQARIQSSAREGMDKAQKDYFLREQLKAIRTELGDKDEEGEEELENLKAALNKAGLPKDVRKEADKQLRRLAGMHADSSEANVVRTYLDWLVELPWKKLSRDRLDIAYAKQILDEDHCGLEKVKDRILEFLSVRKLNPQSKGPILCFAGPPGVGKTSLGRSIARAMGRKFQRLSLGGMHDEAEIRGHRRTYIGAMPGRIIQSIKQAGTRNPVVVLDEVDKLGSDFRGDPSSALLEVLDPEQNYTFSDHYLNVPFDLSKVMFLCTANHLETIPAALRDRMEVITLPGYTMQEKAEIARKHLLPKKIKENGLEEKDVILDAAALEKVIREYTREAGLRNLERELSSICRKLARRKAEGKKGPFRVDAADVEKLLGAPRFIEDEKEKKLMPGMALGLAWTPAGGEVLTVEATVMKGKGGLTLTGQLGDVMKESAQAALSYIRSRADDLGVNPSFVSEFDIHVHVPAGATPKDGPSAGVTLTTALISALSGRRVRADLCMTGEITLQGRVLPVGGIKEKILAGVARGLKHVIIPWQNTKDLEDVPKELLKRITVHPVHHYDELLPLVFEDKGSRGGASGTDKNRKNKEESKKETVAARPRKPAASGGGRKAGQPQPEAGA
ncbi:endopeptidase La [Desulfovibrio sp. 86]|uniref:Lon protease n=1 Tax=uncultured Desulfovibrio sp. TaxID=167968 RepID=A0A212LBA1_9BACT|nr:endopeptidase La [Desulfovibrio sp. 86]SCM74619.1 Lon protease [uncultured Desulfovibrio sp.]VZH34944.1 Lon protease 2 [Desulfovibrio sp. 86]